MKHIEDKKNTTADTLSCYPSLGPTADNTDIVEAEEVYMATVASIIASTYIIKNDIIVLDS